MMSTLKLAIQKEGRLNTESLELLKKCGLKIENGSDQLKVAVSNFPLELLFLRNSDIPRYLEDGVADLGIIGENLLIEKQTDAAIIERLGFSKCRVSLAVPKEIETNDFRYFDGKKIATSYPNTVNRFFESKGISCDVHMISGSVEIAPNIGLADGICDIVSTGSTLFKNGLRETEILLTSEAVLVQSNQMPVEKQSLVDTLKFRMQSVLSAQRLRYVLMNVPNEKIAEITNILPVLKSPTVLPLAEPGWSSLHSVIDQDTFWQVIDALKNAGAEGILVIPIEKIVQ